VSVATAGKKVTGDLVAVDDASITIITAFGKRHRFDRAQVSEIRVRRSPVGKTAPVVTIAGVGLVVANAATRPAEAGPGVAWLIGMPMAILGGIAMTQQLRPSELVYQRLPTPPVTRK